MKRAWRDLISVRTFIVFAMAGVLGGCAGKRARVESQLALTNPAAIEAAKKSTLQAGPFQTSCEAALDADGNKPIAK